MTKIFISYTLNDTSKTAYLIEKLQHQFGGDNVWFETRDISMRISRTQHIYNSIKQADVLVYLMTKASVKSPYCRLEWEYAIDQDKLIVPVFMEDTDFPPGLPHYRYFNLETWSENEFNKLVEQIKWIHSSNQRRLDILRFFDEIEDNLSFDEVENADPSMTDSKIDNSEAASNSYTPQTSKHLECDSEKSTMPKFADGITINDPFAIDELNVVGLAANYNQTEAQTIHIVSGIGKSAVLLQTALADYLIQSSAHSDLMPIVAPALPTTSELNQLVGVKTSQKRSDLSLYINEAISITLNQSLWHYVSNLIESTAYKHRDVVIGYSGLTPLSQEYCLGVYQGDLEVKSHNRELLSLVKLLKDKSNLHIYNWIVWDSSTGNYANYLTQAIEFLASQLEQQELSRLHWIYAIDPCTLSLNTFDLDEHTVRNRVVETLDIFLHSNIDTVAIGPDSVGKQIQIVIDTVCQSMHKIDDVDSLERHLSFTRPLNLLPMGISEMNVDSVISGSSLRGELGSRLKHFLYQYTSLVDDPNEEWLHNFDINRWDLWLNALETRNYEGGSDRLQSTLIKLRGLVDQSNWNSIFTLVLMLINRDLSYLAADSRCKNELRNLILKLLDIPDQLGVKVAHLGEILMQLGDKRTGIGTSLIVVNGQSIQLPDIDWVKIPISRGKNEVTVIESFSISRYTVTYSQFQCFIDSSDYQDKEYWGDFPIHDADNTNTYINRPNHPVVGVSWYEAVAFCRWLTVKLQEAGQITSNMTVRLPNEYEWEHIACGTDNRIYPWGNYQPQRRANICPNGIGGTTVVGLFPDSSSYYGIMDMSGNVWEWCSSYLENNKRVLKGGSFKSSAKQARIQSRLVKDADYRALDCGFRVVLECARKDKKM